MTNLWFNLAEKQQAQVTAILLRIILRQIKLTQEVNQRNVINEPNYQKN